MSVLSDRDFAVGKNKSVLAGKRFRFKDNFTIQEVFWREKCLRREKVFWWKNNTRLTMVSENFGKKKLSLLAGKKSAV